jgi:peptidoglycan/xylan/chitin deacetylase (PgdA/CDA1 family)
VPNLGGASIAVNAILPFPGTAFRMSPGERSGRRSGRVTEAATGLGSNKVVRVDRRKMLQAAVALGVVPLAGCDEAGPAPAPAARSAPDAPSGPPSPAVSPSHAALPAEVTNGPRDKPNIALTFHGQGEAAQIRTLLGELEKGGARVTVLAVGSWLSAQPDMAKRILDGGHELGNHTQSHGPIATMDAAHAFTEINTCGQLLKRLTGSIGTWFRPSQTQHATPLIRAQATRAGYPTCLSYDLDSLDYTDPAPAAVVSTVAKSVQNGSIVSLHFGHATTVTAIPEILDHLRQRGLHPVTMTELVG